MDSKQTILFLIFAFVIGLLNCAIAQTLVNPSFEGTPQAGIPPSPWFACNSFSSPDTQPGSWGVSSSASDGNTFISLVTRDDNTMEAIGAKLNAIKTNVCYNVSIDLSASDQFNYGGAPYGPVILKVWMSTGECLKTNLIWTSPLIDHPSWKTYSFNFTGNKIYSHFIMEVNYAHPGAYVGSMLLDNVRIEEIKISLGNDRFICSGQTVKIDIENVPEKVLWNDGGEGYNREVGEGIYSVQVQRQNCLLRDTVAVKIQPPISFELPKKISLCDGRDTTVNVASANANYLWSTGSVESSINIKEAGKYWVEVSTICETAKGEIAISTREKCCEVTVPDVFTPNNDKANDFLTVSTESNIATYDLKVFNRWGGLVYESKTLDNFWNGQLTNGNEASSGVYYYTIHLLCIENNKIIVGNFKGPLTVIK
jgi:gliding motility-associated-like protein